MGCLDLEKEVPRTELLADGRKAFAIVLTIIIGRGLFCEAIEYCNRYCRQNPNRTGAVDRGIFGVRLFLHSARVW